MKHFFLATLACDAVSIRGASIDGAGAGRSTDVVKGQQIDSATAEILGAYYPGPIPGTYVIRGNSMQPGIAGGAEIRSFYPGCSSSGRKSVLEAKIVSEEAVGPCAGAGGGLLVELVVSY